MKYIEIDVNSDNFEYNGIKFDCELVVARDKELILQEAEKSHKEALETLYDKESLTQQQVKLYVDDNGNPVYLMMIYVIKYKDPSYGVLGTGRLACGDYYPIELGYVNNNGFNAVYPHPYQTSICW